MTAVQLQELRGKYSAYMKKVKATGEKVVTYRCPGCNKRVETRKPKDRSETWDSAATCPYCGSLHFLVIPGRGRIKVTKI